MKTSIAPLRLALLTAAFVSLHSSFVLAQGGPLTPPGAPAPTMRSLQEIFTQDTTTQTNVGAVQTSVNNLQDDTRTAITALPVNITVGGSYYITGSLTAPVSGVGISINASNVTLDLNGFELIGNGGGAGLFGIRVATARTNVTIRNGTVRGWTGDGLGAENVNCTDLCVESVRAIGNGGQGIALGDDGTATDCTARGNVSTGIAGGTGCRIIACTATGQTGAGIDVGDRAVVKDCVASANGADGINVGSVAVVSHCTARFNTGDGIQTGNGAMVQGCATGNNTGIGILTGAGATVSDSIAETNAGGSGISVGIGSSLSGCVARSNTSAAATSQGILTGASCTVSQCTVSTNISTAAATASTGMGISVAGDCVVERCNVTGNKGDGIRATIDCRIIGNQCSTNANFAGDDGAGIHTISGRNYIDGNMVLLSPRGIDIDSAGNTIVRNRALLNTASYVVVASNHLGAIVVPGNNAAINGNAAVASSLGTTDPWANFSE